MHNIIAFINKLPHELIKLIIKFIPKLIEVHLGTGLSYKYLGKFNLDNSIGTMTMVYKDLMYPSAKFYNPRWTYNNINLKYNTLLRDIIKDDEDSIHIIFDGKDKVYAEYSDCFSLQEYFFFTSHHSIFSLYTHI